MAVPSKATFPGIHHITAICSDPQNNLDFYAGLLGLRLVKKTVNYDDPTTYHLYYGDGLGSPGTIMTFFAWLLPPTLRADARQGNGQIAATSFLIGEESLAYWVDRLITADTPFDGPHPRFGEQVISLFDPDRLPLELVARPGGELRAPWQDGPIPAPHAIQGFAGATIALDGYERTAALLTQIMKFRELGQEGSRFRFQVGEGEGAGMIDLLCQPEAEAGRMGIGAVHHIAWRARSDDEQLEWRRMLVEAGFDVTPVLDRSYFRSVYYREPGGVLFEIATDAPGFTLDEAAEQLGTQLQLPAWLEPRRPRIEARLPELRAPVARRG